jgi:hypothetical protein
MTALAALALTVLVLLAFSGAATQLTKARKSVRARTRRAARRMRAALKPTTVARRSTSRKGNRR